MSFSLEQNSCILANKSHNGGCQKRRRVIARELGVASPAGSFLLMTVCLVMPLGALYSLRATGQAKSAGLCTGEKW